MAEVVGVIFRGGVKIYHFDPAGLELMRGDRVVVQTSSGPEIGQVVEPPHTVEDSDLPAPLKKVVRVATGKDLENEAAAEDLRHEAMDTARALIAQHGLDMKLVDADIGFGGEKITFCFFAEERVDFRALVADLAKALKRRIELRQVGAREEARMVGGLGPCGRVLCCSCFPGDDTPVSIRMAKEQNLPLNPMKISGLCGRLMCCLKYEQEQYVTFRKEAPAKGTKVVTLSGEGVVAGYNVTKEAIVVRLEDGSMTEVRLSACEVQEDGGLVVVPEVPKEELAPVSWLDSGTSFDRLKEIADDETVDLPVVEAEIILNEKGEPVEVAVTESTRRPRRRRGGSRRRGRGRGTGEGELGAAGSGAGATDAASVGRRSGAGTAGAEGSGRRTGSGTRAGGPGSGGQRSAAGGGPEGAGEAISGRGGSPRSRRRRGSPQGGERAATSGETRASEGGSERPRPGGGAGDQAAAGTGARRRRRRPRRPGAGSGGGSNNGGAPSGGSAGSGSGSGE